MFTTAILLASFSISSVPRFAILRHHYQPVETSCSRAHSEIGQECQSCRQLPTDLIAVGDIKVDGKTRLGQTKHGFRRATILQKSAQPLDKRIVGGSDADIADYPYNAAIQIGTFQFCGGVIIGSKWVITAAHCIQDETIVPLLYVRVGSSRSDSGGQLISISRAIVHPDYVRLTLDYDIALLNLSEEISSSNARSIRLPYQGEKPNPGLILTVTGWGDITADGESTEILQVVEVPAIEQTICRRAYPNEDITDRMFCAGYLDDGGKDSCTGDSGGPIVNLNRDLLLGLVSWGYVCADPGNPGVYTSVGMLRNWIQSNTGI